ncbi:MAG: hypothetical protein IKA36_02055 [Clostridia bacterium]|nr:hypothetical protein [Clostridia bacterium]
MELFGTGIPISTGFDLAATRPLDSRTWVETHAEMEAMPAIRKHPNLKTYVHEENTQYRWTGSEWVVDNTAFCSGSGDPTIDTGMNGDIYINIDTADMWYKAFNRNTQQIEWAFMLKLTGPKGDQGVIGPTGKRGSLWSTGSACTGTDPNGVIFPNTNITLSYEADQYLNTLTGNVYTCVEEGSPTVAKWAYSGCILGPVGPKGDQGIQGIQGERGLQGEQGVQGIHGSYIFTTTEIYGPTPQPMTFPNATEMVLQSINIGDYCVNIEYGHMYEAMSEGLGNEVLWMRCAIINGSKVYVGETIGSSNGADVNDPTSSIPYANLGDIYINNGNGQLLMCITEGVPSVAVWRLKGALTIESAINDTNGNAITSYVRELTNTNNVLTIERGDGTTKNITLACPVFTGASATSDGKSGSVPAPAAGDTSNVYLNANGSWKAIPVYGIANANVAGLIKPGSTVTIDENGFLNVSDNAHKHTIANITDLQTELDSKSPKNGNTELNQLGSNVNLGSGVSGSVSTSATGASITKIELNPTEDGTAFEFKKSTDAGANYNSLGKLRDDGTLEVVKVKADLEGTASNARLSSFAERFYTSRNIGISGAVEGDPTPFDGSNDITILTKSLDASKLTGSVPIECLPKDAVSTIKVVANDEARFALTIADVQNGDIVNVDDTKMMYYVVDQTKLSTEEGYKEFVAGAASSVPWTGVTNKPESYPPSEHTHPYIPNTGGDVKGDIKFKLDGTDGTMGVLGGLSSKTDPAWALQGVYAASALQYLEMVTIGNVPIYIRQMDDGVTTVNREIKLFDENGNTSFPGNVSAPKFLGELEGQATKAVQDASGNNIEATYIENASINGRTITFEKGDGTQFSYDTYDTTYETFVGATDSANGSSGLVPAPTVNDAHSYLRGDGEWVHLNPEVIKTQLVTLTIDGWVPVDGKYRQEVVCIPTIDANTNIMLIPTSTEANIKAIWNNFIIGIEQDNENNKIIFQADYLPVNNVEYTLQYYLE